MKLDDIARLAGVSRTTASYVINGKSAQYRVSQRTQDKVMAVVEKYNYQPNASAVGLRAGKSRSIGLIIPDLANRSYTRIARRLEQQTRKLGYQLIISCSDDDPDTELQCAQNLCSRSIEALVVASVFDEPPTFYQKLIARGIPLIALDREIKSTEQAIGGVVGDSEMDAYQLSKALLEIQPLESLLYIDAHTELKLSQQRRQGFDRALAETAQSPWIFECHCPAFDRDEAKAALDGWLDEHGKLPDAICCTSYTLLQGVLNALRERGDMPEKMVLATFGDHDLLDYLPLPVLAMAQPHHDIAERLTRQVMAAVRGKPLAEVEKVPRQLRYRGQLRDHARAAD